MLENYLFYTKVNFVKIVYANEPYINIIYKNNTKVKKYIK